MAPNAPTPSYDEDGNLQLGWLIVLRYDPNDGAVVMSWSKDGDIYRSSKHGAVGFMPDEVEDILEGVATTVQMLTSPSLL